MNTKSEKEKYGNEVSDTKRCRQYTFHLKQSNCYREMLNKMSFIFFFLLVLP